MTETRRDPPRDRSVDERDEPLGDVDVPPDAEPVDCPHCGRPFPTAEVAALHEHRRHREALSAAERERVDEARESEAEALRLFQLKALLAVVVLYFGFVIVYALFT